MKRILRKPNQALVLTEALLFNVIFYTYLLWFPYFFSVLGYENYANNIVLTVPLVAISCPIIFEILIKPFERHSNRILGFSLGLSTIAALGLVIVGYQPQTEEIVVYYFVLVILQGVFYEPPFCRVIMSELSLEAQNDEKVIYYMHALLNGLECIITTFLFYSVGYLIEKSRDF